MKLSDLKPAPYNPREIADDALAGLAQSVEDFGDLSGIVWNERSGFLVCGHQRLEALRQRGAEFSTVDVSFVLNGERFPIRVVDWDEQTERAANVTANNPHISGDWTEGLSGVLEGLKGDLPNFEGLNLDKLLADAPQEAPEIVEDEVPESPSDPITKPGDLWVLGRHRLLCGDSTKAEDVGRLMAGEKAALVFSDPPYGIAIVHGGKVGGQNIVEATTYSPVRNDDSTETAKAFYELCVGLGLESFIIWGGNYFTDFLPPSSCWLVWDKENTGNFADVEMAWTCFSGGAKLYRWMWNGMARKGEMAIEGKSRLHPTQKPVGLTAEILSDFNFAEILDGFLGSGTTLIAAEQLDRRCFGLEIEPKYCDVVIERWQNLTGEKAKREPV